MPIHPQKVIVIDVEASCWEKKKPKGQHHDIIEYGLAVLDIANGQIIANEGILVHPTTSEISPFCTQLTTITPAMIEQEGRSFAEASAYLTETYQAKQYIWASYGAYDFQQIHRQCQREGVPFPLSGQHLNVKALFALKMQTSRPVGMAEALRALNIPLEGTHHRGVDDARNIAKILLQLLK